MSAGTGLPAMVRSVGASVRHHTQNGGHPGGAIYCELLTGVAYVPCFSKDGVQECEAQ